jgi:hypothetical protein
MFWMPSFYMCASLAREQLDGFYSYSEFKSLSILCHCLENVIILAPKIVVPHGVPQAQNLDFLKKCLKNFDYIL